MRDSADGGRMDRVERLPGKKRQGAPRLSHREKNRRAESVGAVVGGSRTEEEGKGLPRNQQDECNIRNWRCRLARSDLRSRTGSDD
jgi:hypothetical protein